MTYYYISWSLKTGEATYTKSFDTAEARDKFAAGMACICKSIDTWERKF